MTSEGIVVEGLYAYIVQLIGKSVASQSIDLGGLFSWSKTLINRALQNFSWAWATGPL